MSPRFTLHQLEYLIAVADEGSISAAAAATHSSPGGVSMAVSDLARRLAVPLFIRLKPKALTLTAEGARILGDARRIVAAAEELQTATSTQNEISGMLAV